MSEKTDEQFPLDSSVIVNADVKDGIRDKPKNEEINLIGRKN